MFTRAGIVLHIRTTLSCERKHERALQETHIPSFIHENLHMRSWAYNTTIIIAFMPWSRHVLDLPPWQIGDKFHNHIHSISCIELRNECTHRIDSQFVCNLTPQVVYSADVSAHLTGQCEYLHAMNGIAVPKVSRHTFMAGLCFATRGFCRIKVTSMFMTR